MLAWNFFLERVVFRNYSPYYGNVAYSELSDFYVWLRRSLAGVYPQ